MENKSCTTWDAPKGLDTGIKQTFGASSVVQDVFHQQYVISIALSWHAVSYIYSNTMWYHKTFHWSLIHWKPCIIFWNSSFCSIILHMTKASCFVKAIFFFEIIVHINMYDRVISYSMVCQFWHELAKIIRKIRSEIEKPWSSWWFPCELGDQNQLFGNGIKPLLPQPLKKENASCSHPFWFKMASS